CPGRWFRGLLAANAALCWRYNYIIYLVALKQDGVLRDLTLDGRNPTIPFCFHRIVVRRRIGREGAYGHPSVRRVGNLVTASQPVLMETAHGRSKNVVQHVLQRDRRLKTVRVGKTMVQCHCKWEREMDHVCIYDSHTANCGLCPNLHGYICRNQMF